MKKNNEVKLTKKDWLVVVIMTVMASVVFLFATGIFPNPLMGGRATISLLSDNQEEAPTKEIVEENVVVEKVENFNQNDIDPEVKKRAEQAGWNFDRRLNVSVHETQTQGE